MGLSLFLTHEPLQPWLLSPCTLQKLCICMLELYVCARSPLPPMSIGSGEHPPHFAVLGRTLHEAWPAPAWVGRQGVEAVLGHSGTKVLLSPNSPNFPHLVVLMHPLHPQPNWWAHPTYLQVEDCLPKR